MSGAAEPDGRVYAGVPLAERRADQRARLLAAARDVFAARGYSGASVDEIVAGARVSRTAFYRFFENKERCLLELFAAELDRLAKRMMAAVGQADTPEEQVRAGIRGLVEAFAEDPAAARVVLVEVVGATPTVEEARARARADFAGLLEAELALVEGWRERPASERHLVAMATMAAVAEPVSHLAATGDMAGWRSIVEPVTEYALRALTPP
jgi:AcrR family transcriptional regulator